MVNTDPLRKGKWFWAFLLSSACLGSALGQTVREELVLLDKPDGKITAVKLSAGSSIKVLRRQGFWVEIDASGRTGWAKVSQLNFAAAGSGPTAIDTGRLGTGNIVSTSAARGLSAKDLLNGQPDFTEANKLDALTAEPGLVAAFLSAGAVMARNEKIQLSSQQPPAVSASGPSRQAVGAPPAAKKKGEDDW